MPARPEVAGELLDGLEGVPRGRARGVVADHVDGLQVGVRPQGDTRRPPEDGVGAGGGVDGHHDALGGVPDDVRVPGDEEREELFFGLVGDEAEGELPERHEVLVAEEAVQGVGDLRGRVDVAVQHAPAQLFGGRVDQLELVGPAHHPVGHALADGDAGDLLHGVGDAFQVLDVDRAHDPDPGFEDLEHVFPALGVRPRARDVGVGELVDEGYLGLAGEDGGEVHLLEPGAPVVDHLAGDDGKVADLGGGHLPAVGLDEADHHIGAALVAAPALVQHGPGLADAGDGAQVDAELPGRFDRVVLVVKIQVLRSAAHQSILTARR